MSNVSMEKPTTLHNYQQIQLIAIVIAMLFLTFTHFGGSYYSGLTRQKAYSRYDVSTDTYKSVYNDKRSHNYEFAFLGSDPITTMMILVGLGALVYSLKTAYENYNLSPENISLMKEKTNAVIKGTGFTLILTVIGAVMFAIDYSNTNWWLDSGFYGTFFGSLTALIFAKKSLPILKE